MQFLCRFGRFATSPEASWTANFRDLGASVTRMATFAPSGRITEDVVMEEIDRLKRAWSRTKGNCALEALLGEDKLQIWTCLTTFSWLR